MSQYKVEKTNQPGGIMWAVVYEGQYRFIQKTEELANRLAARLNLIQKRRLEMVV